MLAFTSDAMYEEKNASKIILLRKLWNYSELKRLPRNAGDIY